MSSRRQESAKGKSKRKKLGLRKETLKDLATRDGQDKAVRGGMYTLRACG